MSEIIIFVAIGIVLYLNISASVHLAKSDMYSMSQKAAQYLLIWLVPFIGAAVVLSILMEEPGPGRKGEKASSFLFRLLALTFFFETASSIADGEISSQDSSFDSGGYDSGGGDGGGGDG
ncbi:MAG: hypothetical protein KZQ81_10820 [Candidatus Thiodiazotropha sp. (ex Rostrolucina anterorostrata)]|nr:hypothetical protein [Candidatus Thiodiazotropha sp. (ex Rostrolucina anterorostrata)]